MSNWYKTKEQVEAEEKESEIRQIKRECGEKILSKYPEHFQRNASMGLEDVTEVQQMKEWIQKCREECKAKISEV